MLIEFNFSNYRSFKNKTVLSMAATRITELPHHVVESGGDKILLMGAIFGANASGKSNVYKAFEFMSEYVLYSFSFGGESKENREDISLQLKADPFLFSRESGKQPTEFEVFFTDSEGKREKIYQYGFALKDREIVEEWLFEKAKTSNNYKMIFHREKGEELRADGLTKKSVDMIELALEKEALIVSLGSKLKIAKLKKVRDWFLNNEITDFGNSIENLFRESTLPGDFAKDEAVQREVISYLSSFDGSIQGFSIEESTDTSDEDKRRRVSYKVNTIHQVHDGEGNVEIPLGQESSGTLKMFALYPVLHVVFEKGGVLFVDELNSKLHTLLVRYLILMFADEKVNPKHAQLIFTTHDIGQFSNDILRRDEIWIVQKDEEEVSSLYSLSEYTDVEGNKSRKGESLAKHYIVGDYGGIPFLSPLSIVEGKNEDGE